MPDIDAVEDDDDQDFEVFKVVQALRQQKVQGTLEAEVDMPEEEEMYTGEGMVAGTKYKSPALLSLRILL